VEAEYIALSTAMRDLLPGRALLKEIGAKLQLSSSVGATYISWLAAFFNIVYGCGGSERSHIQQYQKYTCQISLENN